MAPFVTLLAALAAITSPLVQAVPVPLAVAAPQQNCAAALILAQGINENIEDQKNEQAALGEVVNVLKQTPVDAEAFAAAKANLLTFVNNGIAIRQANQLITPLGNKAAEGLAIVANAQLDELNLSQGLTGDPAKDADAIKKLQDGFTGGLAQNQQNMADAMAGCTMANGGMIANGTQDASVGNNNGANKNADDKNADDKNAHDKKADDKKAGDKKADDKKADDKKADDKKADDKKADDKNAHKNDGNKEADGQDAGNEDAGKKDAGQHEAGKDQNKGDDKNANTGDDGAKEAQDACN